MKTVNYSVSKWRSKVDWWFFTAVTLSVPGALLAWPMLQNQGFSLQPADIFTASAISVLMFVIIRFSAWPCEYTLHQDRLEIKCGKLLYKTIYYSDVQLAKKSYNWFVAPTLSFSRIKIFHGGSYSFISPRNRRAFIQELKQRCRNFHHLDHEQHSEMHNLVSVR